MKGRDKKKPEREAVELFEWLNDRRHSSKLFALNEPKTGSLQLREKGNYIKPPIPDRADETVQEQGNFHIRSARTLFLWLCVLFDDRSPILIHISQRDSKH